LIHGFDALRLWRRLTASRVAVAAVLMALLVTSVFATGAFLPGPLANPRTPNAIYALFAALFVLLAAGSF